MKRILAMALSIALIATLAISGTIAYLTDSDEDTNVFTVGNVVIDQQEWQRTGDEEESFERIDFHGDAILFRDLFPAVELGSERSYTDPFPAPEGTGTMSVPSSIQNYLDKIVQVENKGRSDAYIRTIFAVPTAGYTGSMFDPGHANNVIANDHSTWLHLWFNNISYKIIPGTTLINGKPYQLCYVTHEAAVPGTDNATSDDERFTPVSLAGIWMDSNVDFKVNRNYNGEVIEPISGDYYFKDQKLDDISNLQILVASQACQSKGFDTADQALNAAFGKLTVNNNPFVEDAITPVEPTTDEGEEADPNVITLKTEANLFWFADQINNQRNTFFGKTIKLGNDITLTHNWTPICQTGTATCFAGIFDGNGKTIKNLNVYSENTDSQYGAGFFGFIYTYMDGATIKNVTFENANIVGTHYSGVVGGYFHGVLENVHVKNSTVSSYHQDDDACGDKVGALVGYFHKQGTASKVDNCSATNCNVKACRDAAQLIGKINDSSAISSNCSATNVTVTGDTSCSGAADDAKHGQNITNALYNG